jgi:hypothetical protein
MDEGTFDTRLHKILACSRAGLPGKALIELDALIDELMRAAMALTSKRERLMQGLREKVYLLEKLSRHNEARMIARNIAQGRRPGRRRTGRGTFGDGDHRACV